MSEDKLTGILVENLKKGDLRKISKVRSRQASLYRQVGNNSYRADIFISLSTEQPSDSMSFNNASTSFIAIEVKIKDWKQGLYQAWRYNSFAERSYLALYEPYAKNIDIEMFKKYNVGLIVFNETEVFVKNRPVRQTFKVVDEYSMDLRKKIWHSLSTS